MAQPDRFFECVGRQHDRNPVIRKVTDQLVNLFLGAYVEPARRVIKIKIRERAFIHLLSTTFCWLPPLNCRHSASTLGVRTCSFSTQRFANSLSRFGLITPRIFTACS